MKVAVCTGSNGQVGSYLLELLLGKGYKVYGMIRKASTFNTKNIDHLYHNSNLELVYGDLTDYASIVDLVASTTPDLFFNLGAFSHVGASFKLPIHVMDVTGVGPVRCLEAIRKFSPKTRFLQASTSELWGDQIPNPKHNENTIIDPRSPYACAKALGYHITVNYRESYPGLFASNAITFNTESPRRGETFLTRKVTRGATRIKLGLQNELKLGNLTSKRDFVSVYDTIDGLYKIINADKPDDYVLATGVSRSMQEFVEIVFGKLDLDWKKYIKFDQRYVRPAEVPHLRGDATKAKEKLGWEPKHSFEDLVQSMIDSDMELALKEKVERYNPRI
jgi:GDPmannose 4,6-dehydratase